MAEKQIPESDQVLEEIVANPYKYGFTTDIEAEEFPKGLNLDIVKQISQKKDEPNFLQNSYSERRVKSFILNFGPQHPASHGV